MRIIDADDLYRKVVEYNGGAVDKTVAKRLIEQQPTVQRNSTQSNASNTLNALNALDTIYRQAAIDAHCELCVDRDTCNCDICPDVEVFQLLPSAQPEIIFCKDCKHRNTDECPMYYEEWIAYDEGDGFIERDFIPHDRTVSDGFCFKGERREDE